MPVGDIERTKAGAHSSFMERKLQQLNAVAAAPLGSDLLVHRSKLEQAKADADAKARAGLAEARKAPTSTMAAVAGSLGADLRIHKSKLELAKEAAIAASALKAKNIPALQLVVNCAQKNLALEMLNLNAAFAPGTSPIGQLLGLVNGLASLVPGLPNPLIPNLSMLGPDASAAIQPLVTMAATLEALASSIPTP